ncbi:MAG TPA: hypothetical protein VGS41_09575 [Chthonomonadales bacterium]|nr:hypothetical protein [Chthonomonadales bacterium]
MLVTISSLLLVWRKEVVPLGGMAAATAVYKGDTTITYTAFVTSARWPLTICPLVCGTTLLLTPTVKTRYLLAVAHGGCALACIIIPLSRFAWEPGVLAALAGGALLTYGAIDRYLTPAAATK